MREGQAAESGGGRISRRMIEYLWQGWQIG
jgi:hypothetical protein